MEEFKDRIKELRVYSNLTQSQLAAKIDRGEATIRAWESGRAKPDADTLILLSDIFDCSIDYLLGISESKSISYVKDMAGRIDRHLTQATDLTESIKKIVEEEKVLNEKIQTLKYTRQHLLESLKMKLNILDRFESEILRSNISEKDKQSLCIKCKEAQYFIEKFIKENS